MRSDATIRLPKILQLDHILLMLLYFSMYARFLFVTWEFGPMHDINNDWGRHYQSGVQFFSNPTLMGAIDPKLYQLWVWCIHTVSGGNGWAMDFLSGLLCAFMPYPWYRAAGELFSKRVALLLGLMISLHPSFWVIYGYFMNETLLMPMFGLALWFSLRAARLGTQRSYLWAVVVWVLAVHARVTVLPVMGLAVGWLLHQQQHKWMCLFKTLLILVIITLPAAYQSSRTVKGFIPFQSSIMNRVYFNNGNSHHIWRLHDGPYAGHYAWSSPSYYYNPLHPFAFYKTHRIVKPGEALDWHIYQGFGEVEAEIKRLKAQQTTADLVKNTLENTLFMLFSPSWPDSTNPYFWHHRINSAARWVWPPCILIVLAISAFMPMNAARAFIVSTTLALIFSLALQQMGITEGRYRKPLEPLLLFSVVILWQGRSIKTLRSGLYTPLSFGVSFYLVPVYEMLVVWWRSLRQGLRPQAFVSP